jgi:hypothetical protein
VEISFGNHSSFSGCRNLGPRSSRHSPTTTNDAADRYCFGNAKNSCVFGASFCRRLLFPQLLLEKNDLLRHARHAIVFDLLQQRHGFGVLAKVLVDVGETITSDFALGGLFGFGDQILVVADDIVRFTGFLEEGFPP